MIDAILFDLDGVLVNAPEWHKEAFNLALNDNGIDSLDDHAHLLIYNGLSTYKKLELLSEDDVVPASVFWHKKFYRLKQKYTKKIIEEKCVPIQRVVETVCHAQRWGRKIAVVTNCSRETSELMLFKSNLLDKFTTIIANEDVDDKIKPHPWPYVLAQKQLGAKSPLAIDDTAKGVKSAILAGCKVWHLKNFEDLTIENLNRQLGA